MWPMPERHTGAAAPLPFLNIDDIPPATSNKLLDFLNDLSTQRRLKIELAITVDSMEPFLKACFMLEGDRPLALIAYEQIHKLFPSIYLEHYPNTVAMARLLENGMLARERQLIDYAKTCVEPAYAYFKSKFEGKLKPLVQAFKAARIFSPSKANELKPTTRDVNELQCFSFDSSLLEGLKAELVTYLACCDDVSTETPICNWWRNHESEIPK